jgi:hypothetical protein
MIAILVAVALIGHAGEWVTRESDGARICQLSRDLNSNSQEVIRAEGWCDHWTIEPPKAGEAIDPKSGWVRARPSLAGGGAQLHFADGWRP